MHRCLHISPWVPLVPCTFPLYFILISPSLSSPFVPSFPHGCLELPVHYLPLHFILSILRCSQSVSSFHVASMNSPCIPRAFPIVFHLEYPNVNKFSNPNPHRKEPLSNFVLVLIPLLLLYFVIVINTKASTVEAPGLVK